MILNNVKDYLMKKKWNVGFVELAFCDEFLKCESWNIKWMKHQYTDRWFADPFILKVTCDVIELLVEEKYDKINRGRISKLVIDRKSYILKSCKTILELDSHLSFPAIFRYNDMIYIYPENSETKKLLLYSYDEKNEKAILIKKLLDLPLTDAVIEVINDVPYLFSTKLPNQNGNILDIFIGEKWDNDYSFFQSVVFSDNIARNAGSFFKYNGSLIRPSQDCNFSYGSGLVFQKLLLENGVFSFKEIKRFYPSSWYYNLGLHTFNVKDEIAVVDGLGYRHPYCGHLLSSIRNFVVAKL